MRLRHFYPFRILLGGVLLLMLSGCLQRHSPGAIVTGELHGDLVWTGSITVGGDVTLAADARLTILPGTVVRFLPAEGFPGGASEHPHFPGSELNVAGVLTAIGTSGSPIVFAAADAQAPPGSWGAINFAEGSRGTLRYCVFRQADSAVHSREATVEIAESLFEQNLVGIRFHTSDMTIEHNLLRDNQTGIRFHFGAPVVRGNRLESNRVNLFVTAHPRDYLFQNNRFDAPGEYQVILGEDVPEDVLLPDNYWAVPESAATSGWFFDGRRSPYLGQVRVEPSLPDAPLQAGPSWIR